MPDKGPLDVIYLHHTGVFGGASRSLYELIGAFPPGKVRAHMVTQRGRCADLFEERGVDVVRSIGISQFDHTAYGYYRGVRWLIVLRELAYLPFTIHALWRAKRLWSRVRLAHVNEITNVVAMLWAKFILSVPVVVHVRSVQQAERGRLRRNLLRWLLRQMNVVIAIDETVSCSLPSDIGVRIVYNGFRIPEVVQRSLVPENGWSEERPLVVGFVGNLAGLKGIREFVRSAALCVEAGLHVRYRIVGEPLQKDKKAGAVLSVLGLAEDVGNWLKEYVAEHGLEGVIEFTGFVYGVEEIYAGFDVLCFPSKLNAAGRPVLEAACFGVPSIVAMKAGRKDMVVDGESGIVIDQPREEKIFEAVKYFYDHPLEISRMGKEALSVARKKFDIQHNAEKVLALYESLSVNCLEKG